MRHVMTTALTNPQKYKSLMDPSSFSGQSEYDLYCKNSNMIYQDAIRGLPNPEPPEEYRGKFESSYFKQRECLILICIFYLFFFFFRMCIFTRAIGTYNIS